MARTAEVGSEGGDRRVAGAPMSRLIAVDPGRCAGVAEFLGGTLVKAYATRTHEPIDPGGRAVCEKPLVYRVGRGKGDPNGMLLVARSGGRLLALFPEAAITYVPAVRWKGQVDKALMCRRILGFLTEEELAIVPKNHNAIDAVGIGLWTLGRMGRGGVPV